jgi:hypothetical protein
MVADWDCIVRNLLRVADGRVKPVHDVGDERLLAELVYDDGTATAARSAWL